MDAQVALGLSNARQQTKLVRDLKAIRQESGLTVEYVAEQTKLEPSFIVKFEKGGMNFTAATLRAIAKALGAELKLEARKPTGSFVSFSDSSQANASKTRPWAGSRTHVSYSSKFSTTIN